MASEIAMKAATTLAAVSTHLVECNAPLHAPANDVRFIARWTPYGLPCAWEAAEGQAAAKADAFHHVEESLGITAHELRSPLTSSKLAVQLATRRVHTLLADAPTSNDSLTDHLAPVHDLLLQAVDGLDRLSRLVGDLADVSRLHAGVLALRLTACDLAAVVRDAVAEQRQLAPRRTIRVHVPARRTRPILADGDRIRQVVTNYMTNALRYAPADRPIDVRMYARHGWVQVSVQDEGPGVPASERQRIWERFQRASGTPLSAKPGRNSDDTRLGLGLGLGLHICKAIVELHRGKVGLRSAPGGGSIFWFALPLARLDG